MTFIEYMEKLVREYRFVAGVELRARHTLKDWDDSGMVWSALEACGRRKLELERLDAAAKAQFSYDGLFSKF